MRTNKDINSIFLNEKNIIEILLMILTENGDFANYIQEFAESVYIRKEEGMMNLNNRAAIYCRLSKDDEQSGDSVSIETQRMMLTKYCTENKFEIFDIYVDDGYSGLNFNRPSFKRLIRDLEDGKFNIVITKDLSRLGRDYIQTGYYIDVYFVTKRVRYIAVNDGIDTKHENNDIAPFKNILNDMYAKDLSRKVKSAKQQRAQNGLYISAQPPYGYKVNPHTADFTNSFLRECISTPFLILAMRYVVKNRHRTVVSEIHDIVIFSKKLKKLSKKVLTKAKRCGNITRSRTKKSGKCSKKVLKS